MRGGVGVEADLATPGQQHLAHKEPELARRSALLLVWSSMGECGPGTTVLLSKQKTLLGKEGHFIMKRGQFIRKA